jgi:hypothetical protein
VIRRSCIFLLLGVLTAIVIAWLFVFVTDPAYGRTFFFYVRDRDPLVGEGIGNLDVMTLGAAGTDVYSTSVASTPRGISPPPRAPETYIPSWARATMLPFLGGRAPWPAPGAASDCWIVARGWPFRALWCTWRFRGTPATKLEGGIPLPDWNAAANWPRALPFLPRWPGLILDFLFYALCWIVLVHLVVGFRRWRTPLPGHCPRCNYDLAGIPEPAVCPECGWAALGARWGKP